MDVRLVRLDPQGYILEEHGATPSQLRHRSNRPPLRHELSELGSGFLNFLMLPDQDQGAQVVRSGVGVRGSNLIRGVEITSEEIGLRRSTDYLGLFEDSATSSSSPCTPGTSARVQTAVFPTFCMDNSFSPIQPYPNHSTQKQGVQDQSFISFLSIFDELEQTPGDQDYHVLEKPPVDQEYHGLQKPPVDQEYHGLQKTQNVIQNSSTNLENKKNNNPSSNLSDFGISFSDSDSDSIALDVAENLEIVDGSDSRSRTREVRKIINASNVVEGERFNSSPGFDNAGEKISNIDEDAIKVIYNGIPSSTPAPEPRQGDELNAWPQTFKGNTIQSGSFIHNTADIESFNCEKIISKTHEEEKRNSYVHEENRSSVDAKFKNSFIPERDSVQEEADLMRFSSDTGDSSSDQSQNLDQTLDDFIQARLDAMEKDNVDISDQISEPGIVSQTIVRKMIPQIRRNTKKPSFYAAGKLVTVGSRDCTVQGSERNLKFQLDFDSDFGSDDELEGIKQGEPVGSASIQSPGPSHDGNNSTPRETQSKDVSLEPSQDVTKEENCSSMLNPAAPAGLVQNNINCLNAAQDVNQSNELQPTLNPAPGLDQNRPAAPTVPGKEPGFELCKGDGHEVQQKVELETRSQQERRIVPQFRAPFKRVQSKISDFYSRSETVLNNNTNTTEIDGMKNPTLMNQDEASKINIRKRKIERPKPTFLELEDSKCKKKKKTCNTKQDTKKIEDTKNPKTDTKKTEDTGYHKPDTKMKREASGTKKTRDKLAKKSQFGIIDEHALNLSQESDALSTEQTEVSSGGSRIRNLADLTGAETTLLENCEETCFLLSYLGNVTNLKDKNSFTRNLLSPRSIILRCSIKANPVFYLRFNLSNINQVEEDIFLKILLNPSTRKIVFEAKIFLKALLLSVPGLKDYMLTDLVYLDPLVGCWLLQPDRQLDGFQDCVTVLLPGSRRKDWGNRETVTQDLDTVSELTERMFQQLHLEKLWDVFYLTEMRLLPLLVGMERSGVNIDQGELNRIGELLTAEAKHVEDECHALAGTKFNLASSKQVREVLYDILRLDTVSGVNVGKTAGGLKSSCEAALKKLEPFHPVPGLILKHRQLSKSQAAYIQGLLQHNEGGRIHTTWDQIGAATGRITSVAPNLQAIPKTDIILDTCIVHLRKAFVPNPGYILVSADYEQIELRILAHLSGDPILIKAIRTGGDIFRELAAIWLEKPVSRIQVSDREKTKHVVYALMYGAGKNKLSEILEISPDQAQGIINSFYTKFSQLKSFNRSVVQRAEEKGFLVTMFGRKRCFPHIKSSNFGMKIQSQRQAFNFLIQGTAADILKNAVVYTAGVLNSAGLAAKVILLIHDEIVWEVQDGCRDSCLDLIGRSLENHSRIFPAQVEFKIPLRVKISVGYSLATMATVEQQI